MIASEALYKLLRCYAECARHPPLELGERHTGNSGQHVYANGTVEVGAGKVNCGAKSCARWASALRQLCLDRDHGEQG